VGSNPTPRTKVEPLSVCWELKKLGRAESTLKKILQRLEHLKKNVDFLDNSEAVKEFIANKKLKEMISSQDMETACKVVK
jgi:hypothetical protein